MNTRIAATIALLMLGGAAQAQTATQPPPAPVTFPPPESESLHGPQGAGTIQPIPDKPKTGTQENLTVRASRPTPAPMPHARDQQLTPVTNKFNRSMNPLNRPADCKSDFVNVGGQPASAGDIAGVVGAHACGG